MDVITKPSIPTNSGTSIIYSTDVDASMHILLENLNAHVHVKKFIPSKAVTGEIGS